MAREHRRLAAIVSAEVADYSLLMGRDESATLAALKAHRRGLIDPKITDYGDRIVKYSIAARWREYQNPFRPGSPGLEAKQNPRCCRLLRQQMCRIL